MLILSIIVPVYNVEQYLAKCIDSLLRQDLASEEYEVILVDDGSTDNSGRIAEIEGLRIEEKGVRKLRYVKPETGHIGAGDDYRTPRIRVIHQPNMGLSAARNAGLRIAQGKYVQFVDSDDYLEPNVLGGLVRQMEEQKLDVLRFGFQDVRVVGTENGEVRNENGEVRTESRESRDEREYEVFWPHESKKIIDRCEEIVDGETYLNTRLRFECFAWQFVVRRALLVSNEDENCLFREGLYYEDVEWTPRMLLKANRVNATTKIVYNYLQREGSITKTIDEEIRKKEIETKLYLMETTEKLMIRGKAVTWCRGMIAELVINTLELLVNREWENRVSIINRIKTMDVLPLSTFRQETKRARKIKVINISPWLFVYLLRIKK